MTWSWHCWQVADVNQRVVISAKQVNTNQGTITLWWHSHDINVNVGWIQRKSTQKVTWLLHQRDVKVGGLQRKLTKRGRDIGIMATATWVDSNANQRTMTWSWHLHHCNVGGLQQQINPDAFYANWEGVCWYMINQSVQWWVWKPPAVFR